jgi:hypothetical protein
MFRSRRGAVKRGASNGVKFRQVSSSFVKFRQAASSAALDEIADYRTNSTLLSASRPACRPNAAADRRCSLAMPGAKDNLTRFPIIGKISPLRRGGAAICSFCFSGLCIPAAPDDRERRAGRRPVGGAIKSGNVQLSP